MEFFMVTTGGGGPCFSFETRLRLIRLYRAAPTGKGLSAFLTFRLGVGGPPAGRTERLPWSDRNRLFPYTSADKWQISGPCGSCKRAGRGGDGGALAGGVGGGRWRVVGAGAGLSRPPRARPGRGRVEAAGGAGRGAGASGPRCARAGARARLGRRARGATPTRTSVVEVRDRSG